MYVREIHTYIYVCNVYAIVCTCVYYIHVSSRQYQWRENNTKVEKRRHDAAMKDMNCMSGWAIVNTHVTGTHLGWPGSSLSICVSLSLAWRHYRVSSDAGAGLGYSQSFDLAAGASTRRLLPFARPPLLSVFEPLLVVVTSIAPLCFACERDRTL